MFDYLYEWIQNLAFYLVIITAVLQILPGKSYKRYVQFFSGMVMILLMLTPILKLSGIEEQFYKVYHSKEYELQKEEIEKQKNYFENLDILDFLPNEYQEDLTDTDKEGTEKKGIEVEEIRLGE